MDINIRNIQPQDNQSMALIIRESLKEFGLDIPGTAYFDDSTDHLYETFRLARSQYIVAFQGEELIGGVGIYPTEGLPADTAELVKMYLIPSARGKGLGKRLMKKCIDIAAELGYQYIYLESMPALKSAVSAYEKLGFQLLDTPLGNTGHYSCNIWMLYAIQPDPAAKLIQTVK